MIDVIRGAVAFLTVLPVHGPVAPLGRSAAFFPLVGAALGWVGAGIYMATATVLPRHAAALVTLAFLAILTGGLHEDGFADVADAFRSHRSPDQIMAILKDSRIGTFGALALIFSVLLRMYSLAVLEPRFAVPALVAVHTVSRAAMVGLAWIARPAGDGLGAALIATLSTPTALFAIATGICALFLIPSILTVALALLIALIVVSAELYFHRRLGGVTGDCLGATGHAVEIVALALVVCGQRIYPS